MNIVFLWCRFFYFNFHILSAKWSILVFISPIMKTVSDLWPLRRKRKKITIGLLDFFALRFFNYTHICESLEIQREKEEAYTYTNKPIAHTNYNHWSEQYSHGGEQYIDRSSLWRRVDTPCAHIYTGHTNR